MATTRIDTETEVTTAHKISIGLLVATGMFVGLSAVIAAVYTIVTNVTKSSTPAVIVPTSRETTTLNENVPVKQDNTLETAQ